MRVAPGRVTLAAMAATRPSRRAAGKAVLRPARPAPVLPLAPGTRPATSGVVRTVSGPVRAGRRTKLLVKRLGCGEVLDLARVCAETEARRREISEALERFAHNTIEHMREERELLAGRIDLPRFQTDFRDRSTLVVVRGVGHQRDLQALRFFI